PTGSRDRERRLCWRRKWSPMSASRCSLIAVRVEVFVLNQPRKHWHRCSNHEEMKNTKKTGEDRPQTSLCALRFFVVCNNLCRFDLSAACQNTSRGYMPDLRQGKIGGIYGCVAKK